MRSYDNIVIEFSNIFKADKTIQESLIPHFGIECGPGWSDIIYDLSKQISDWIEAHPEHSEFYITQIKSKFASLRCHSSVYIHEIEEMINAAEKKSAITCEECGEPGTTSVKGWLVCLCDKCRAEQVQEQERKHKLYSQSPSPKGKGLNREV